MIYRQQSYLPIIFQVDEGIILNVNDFLRRNKLSFKKALVVSGMTFSRNLAEQIAERNRWGSYVIINNAYDDVDALKNYIRKNNNDLIVAVGGGKVNDIVKRVSYLTNVNHFSVPTIISNDGLISPVAVIRDKSEKTESLPGMMPMGVLIDIDIIKKSPLRFIRAAAGDILSNISATNDWILAFKTDREQMNDIAFHLSKSAANALIHYENIDLRNKQFLRLVVQGQVNSGIAMSLAGSSRPCSGSEHLISHAIDYLSLSHNTLHGIQVASISLFTLYLQRKLDRKYLLYANSVEIPLNFTVLINGFSKPIFYQILDQARVMRPGRYTVLEEFSNDNIFEEYSNYIRFINNERS